jgi:hypothetical protein
MTAGGPGRQLGWSGLGQAGLRPENLRVVERPREEAKGAAEDFG